MDPRLKTVTISWRKKHTGEWCRLAVSPKTVVFFSFLFVASCLCAATLSISWVNQRNELNETISKYTVQNIRMQRAEEKIRETKGDLSRLRSEEIKIRSWLGLGDEGSSTPDEAENNTENESDSASGGKGNIGNVTLGSVSPSDRTGSSRRLAAGESVDDALEVKQLLEDFKDLSALVQNRKKEWDAVPAITPISGDHWISSSFGWRKSPFTGKREFHAGIDMAGRKGTPILAAADGRVTKVVRSIAMGPSVTIRHKDGVETIYGHLNTVLVKNGQTVSRGEKIGEMGSLGKRSTGPHLHYAVRVKGKYVDPWNYILDRGRGPYTVAKK